jgi:Flp pilus assembly protein TadB
MNEKLTKDLWQSQPASTVALSEQELRRQADQFQRAIRHRNAGEYAAAMLVVPIFAFYLWAFPYFLMQLGSVMTIVACLFVVLQLRRRATRQALPSDQGALPCLAFHRAELVRQRDALRSVWRWYVAPFVPGMIVFRWGVETQLPPDMPFGRGMLVNVGIVLVLAAVVLLNLYAARKLQRQIDRLDASAGQGSAA